MKLFNRQRGDTILEVLIAVAVLSLILAISYSLANRSSQGNRQAQERSEASKHTESQIELLKSYISQPLATPPPMPGEGTRFCMKKDGSGPTNVISGSIPSNAQAETFTAFSASGLEDCKIDNTYYSYIERGTGTNKNRYTAHTRWIKVSGNGIDEATMVHRLYSDVISLSGGAGGGTTNATACPEYYYTNSNGGCTKCDPGYYSPGGPACSALPATIAARVQKIRPLPGNITPSCFSNDSENRAGIDVRLSNSTGYDTTAITDANSTATFDGLPINTAFNAAVTAPSGYSACPPSSSGVSSGGPSSRVNINFKIIPNCYVATFFEPVISWAYETRYDPQTIYWWQNTGPTWGPYGLPKTNPRYAIGDPKGGYPNDYYANENSIQGRGPVLVHYDNSPFRDASWPGNGGTAHPDHYNRFEQWSGVVYNSYQVLVPYTTYTQVTKSVCPA